MTRRERILAVVHGRSADQKPMMAWAEGGPQDAIADALIFDWNQLPNAPIDGSGLVVLAAVVNPFGLAHQRGLDLITIYKSGPEQGDATLNTLCEEVRARMLTALALGADGIFYVLHGARGAACTPMQYGGWFLERDRELLASVSGASLNAVYVVGGSDTYLDVVCDLPAHLFAWDVEASAISSKSMRMLHAGPQATADPASEVVLSITHSAFEKHMEKESVGRI